MLNGTESWHLYDKFYYISGINVIANTIPLCSHFISENDLRIHSISANATSDIRINYDNGVGGVDNFKSWLAAQAATKTPVTVYYELNKPIVYKQNINTYSFDGEVTITGANSVDIIDGNVLRVENIAPFEMINSNPNLLDNPFFINPINQRGKTEYTGSGYTIDRWKSVGLGSIYLNKGYNIKLTTSTKWSLLFQEIEGISLNSENVFTFSVLFNTVQPNWYIQLVVRKGINNLINNIFYVNDNLATISTIIPENILYKDNVYLRCAIGYSQSVESTCEIIATKLESGFKQTLAYQVDNQWVLNDSPPNYTTELLKCQRYFRIAQGRWSASVVPSTQKAYAFISSFNMRQNPSIEVKANGTYAYNGVQKVVEWSNIGTQLNGGINIIGTIENVVSATSSVVISDAELWLSADL